MTTARMEKDNLNLRKLEESVEYYLGSISTGSRIIYLSIITICFLILLSLFLIRVRIFITVYGIFRPEAENTRLHSQVQGRADSIFTEEGQAVRAGDTLLVLDYRQLLHNLEQCRKRKYELEAQIGDIEHINASHPEKVASDGLRLAYRQFVANYRAAQIKHDKAVRERDRQKGLFLDSLISEKDFDDLIHAEKILNNEISVIASTYYSDLENLHEQLLQEYRGSLLQEEKLLKEISNNHIIAPVSGYIVEFSGIYPGSEVSAGQPLFTISPDTSLIAEIYLPPSKAGYVQKGQNVRILVDSYNFREWGSLGTSVEEISSDVLMINDSPYFRIKCIMKEDLLRLKNGTTGRLRQGMTFRARLLLNERTLAQVIFDRVEKWILPETQTKK